MADSPFYGELCKHSSVSYRTSAIGSRISLRSLSPAINGGERGSRCERRSLKLNEGSDPGDVK